MSFLRYLSIITPAVAVAIARERGMRPIKLKDIGSRASMTRQRAAWIFHQDNWDMIPLGEVVRFLHGCGIEAKDMARHVQYIRRTMKSGCPLAHIELQSKPVLRTLSKRLTV